MLLSNLGPSLHVFICEAKSHGVKDEFDYNKKTKVVYLNIESMETMKESYLQMVGCFLSSKKEFIK